MIHLQQNLVLLLPWSTTRDDGMKKALFSSQEITPFSVLAVRTTRCLEMTNLVNTTTSKDDG